MATTDKQQEVLRPASPEECSAMLRSCNERKQTIAPIGGGTKMDWGNPLHADVLLEMRGIRGIQEHSWQDMTAIVDAGTTWAEMQNALAQHGQRVALDPLWPERATVGGIVATNDSGSLRLRYGPLRDLIIGMNVVLADGTMAKSGGKVVKNVAGYDLHKLMTGALGTLGVVTQVAFRLHPVERDAQTWTLHSHDAESLGAALLKVLDSTLTPMGMQLRFDARNGFALDIRFASAAEALAASETKLREICSGISCEPGDDAVWNTRERLFADDAWTLKATMLPDKIPAVLAGFGMAANIEVEAECIAEAAGIATVSLRGDTMRVLGLMQDLRSRLAGSGGTLVILTTPKSFEETEAAAKLDRWGGIPPAIAVMREVKQQFDPNRVLNPGRFVGGI